jgi:hypothetical protein
LINAISKSKNYVGGRFRFGAESFAGCGGIIGSAQDFHIAVARSSKNWS